MKKIVGLDAMRAIAVLLVIRSHWGPNSIKTVPPLTFFIQKILPSGTFGVDFFFVLSGFLITGILLKTRSEKGGTFKFQTLRIFIIRRSLRIFPIYYILLGVLYILNYPEVRYNFVYFITYTANFLSFHQSSWNSLSHTWTLSVEEQFYLIWPVLIIFTPSKYLLHVILFIIIGSTATHIITERIYGVWSMLLTFNCFNAFAIGGLYSYSFFEKFSKEKISRSLFLLLPFALILYVLTYYEIYTLPIRLINSIISINLIIYIVEKKYGRVSAIIIENRFLNSLGKVSYGIYLFHYIISYYYYIALGIIGVKRNSADGPNSFFYIPIIAEILQLSFLISVSYFSYYFIESQILKLKKRFEYRNLAPEFDKTKMR